MTSLIYESMVQPYTERDTVKVCVVHGDAAQAIRDALTDEMRHDVWRAQLDDDLGIGALCDVTLTVATASDASEMAQALRDAGLRAAAAAVDAGPDENGWTS